VIYYEHKIVPVRYVGGPLDGDLNDTDYAEHELEELLEAGEPWDFTPATIDSRAREVIERYRLECRPGDPVAEWAYVHAGTFDMPDEDRSITPLFVGGPKDGETTTFLGTIRTRPELAASHFPGYRLHHDGDDPLSGWQMLYAGGQDSR